MDNNESDSDRRARTSTFYNVLIAIMLLAVAIFVLVCLPEQKAVPGDGVVVSQDPFPLNDTFETASTREPTIEERYADAHRLEARFRAEADAGSYAARIDRFTVFQTYLALGSDLPQAMDDAERLVNEIVADTAGDAHDIELDTTAQTLLPYADGSHGERPRAMLAPLYGALIAEAKRFAFDPTARYRDQEMDAIRASGKVDPFRCSSLTEELLLIVKIGQIVGRPSSEITLWKRQVADALATNHICEDGSPAPELDQAYDLYVEIGDAKEARVTAKKLAERSLYSFVYGGDIYQPWDEIPAPLDPMELSDAILWLQKAGLSEAEIRTVSGIRAKQVEAEGYDVAAAILYDRAGLFEDAKRCEAIAVVAPLPDERRQTALFLTHVADAETPP